MEAIQKYTLAALVENEAGVLSQVSRLIARKGFNIESLTVGATDNPTISRMTIEVLTDEPHITLICNQLRKMFSVLSVKLLDPEQSIRRELVLIKVSTPTHNERNEVIQIANIFRASIIDVSHTTITLSLIGDDSKTNAIEDLLREFGILELLRTGITALERGVHTIYEETKERGGFNYGKNVL